MILQFPQLHGRGSANSACMRASVSNETFGMPRSPAARTIECQYRPGIEPARFISLAVDGALPMTTPNLVGPPKASIMSETVSIHQDYRNSVDGVKTFYKISVDKACQKICMDEAHDRLRKARIAAGLKSAAAAAKRFGWTASTYSSHENGQTTPMPYKAAAAYAAAFKVSTGWLLTGDGEPAAQNRVEIVGKIGAGGAIDTSSEQIGPDGLYDIEVPFALPDGVVAYEIDGDSMWPRYDSGDVIICYKYSQNPDELLGFEAAVTTADGSRLLKRILRHPGKKTFDLESHNAPPMRDVKVTSVSSIHSVVRAGTWRKLDIKGRRRALRAG